MTAPGERDLLTLLRALRPAVTGGPFAFACVRPEAVAPYLSEAVGMVREDEGVTLVIPAERAERDAIPFTGLWARLTLTVHSSLAAVGLTAAVAGRLADHGVSANVLAGFHHDHLFVPWGERDRAVGLLTELSREAGPTGLAASPGM